MRTKYKLELYRGDTYRRSFRFWKDKDKTDPYDLTDVDVKAEIRDKTAGFVVIKLECFLDATAINLVHLIIGDVHWQFGIPERGVWDMQFTYEDTSIYTPISGPVLVSGDVTESAI